MQVHCGLQKAPHLVLVSRIADPSRECSPIFQADRTWGYSVGTLLGKSGLGFLFT